MTVFHVRDVAQNSYFVQLLLTSTIAVFALQLIAASASSRDESLVWLRSGMVGCWTMCTVSAGLIGFQRYRGTLVHLVIAPIGTNSALVPIIASAATFGLLAFPIAGAAALTFRLDLGDSDLVLLLVAILIFWISAVSMSLVIAAIFVLTPNALVYESLIATPVILLAGIFGYPTSFGAFSDVARILPLRSAVIAIESAASDDGDFGVNALAACALSVLWVAGAALASLVAMRRALRDGTLDLV